jgi:hypothetical protein
VARAAAREVSWAQMTEVTGRAFPVVVTAGRQVEELRVDLDSTIVVAHSEKENAAATFKGSWGYHRMLATLDNTGEFLAAVLQAGNAGANDAADHIAVLDAALAQIPDEYRHGTPIPVRADTAAATKAFLAHVIGLRQQGMSVDFSVAWRLGAPGNTMHAAVAAQPDWAWTPAVDENADPVEHAGVVDLTEQLLALNPKALTGYPAGMRIIVRRERPHPVRSWTCSKNPPAGATPPSPPPPASGDSAGLMPDVAPTPEWKTGSAARRTPGWAGSRPASSRSTRRG